LLTRETFDQIDVLVKNVDKTIAASKGEIIMSDKEKFEGFKQKMKMKSSMARKSVKNSVTIL
jgi:hypothetical protein